MCEVALFSVVSWLILSVNECYGNGFVEVNDLFHGIKFLGGKDSNQWRKMKLLDGLIYNIKRLANDSIKNR